MGKTATKKRKNPPVEIRPHQDNRTLIDEIVATDIKSMHVEQMSDSEFWMGVYFNDSEKRLCVWFTAEDNGKITIRAEIED